MYEETAEHGRFLMRAAGRGSSVEKLYARSTLKWQIRGAQVLTFDIFTPGLQQLYHAQTHSKVAAVKA
jgi:hypothetical protein